LSCYQLMTRNMDQAIGHTEFNDSVWVGRLLRHFADYYFNALETYEGRANPAPVAWQIAFDAAVQGELSVIQHLLLGVNAHINYDLIFATIDLLDSEWAGLSAEMRAQRRADFEMVNTIIQRTVDEVQDTIIERRDPRLDLLDRFMGPLDEWLISRLIEHWRDEVWEQSVIYLNTPESDQRIEFRQRRETRVVHLADTILLQGI
jgi:hypothetical protein